MTKEKYVKCTSDTFKTDLSELCENCPLTDLIITGIKKQIVFQAEQQKSILSKQDFQKYLTKENLSAIKSMEEIYIAELQNEENKNDQYRKNRIEIYIWNKERAKALKKFIDEEEQPNRPEYNPTISVKQKHNVKSFTWNGTSDQLKKLYDKLIDPDNGFIDPSTDFKDFAAIFSGQTINDNFQRVSWVKIAQKNKSIVKNAVFTLFDSLNNGSKIPVIEIQNKPELFKKLKACFCDGKTGKPLKLEHSHCKYSKEFGNTIEQIISSL